MQRAEEHLDQQRIVDRSAPTTSRAETAARRSSELVVVDQLADQPREVVVLRGKLRGAPPPRSSSKSLVNRSVTPGKTIAEPICGASANSSQPNRSCRSSRASGPACVPLGA